MCGRSAHPARPRRSGTRTWLGRGLSGPRCIPRPGRFTPGPRPAFRRWITASPLRAGHRVRRFALDDPDRCFGGGFDQQPCWTGQPLRLDAASGFGPT